MNDSLVEVDGLQYEVDPHDDMSGSESDLNNEINADVDSDVVDDDKSPSEDEVEMTDCRRVVQKSTDMADTIQAHAKKLQELRQDPDVLSFIEELVDAKVEKKTS